ncbi:MAG: DnaD domain protein [Oscillospiraceae bacterium]|nr:DnaD domain protein [Oscillospiraceae bacterium]
MDCVQLQRSDIAKLVAAASGDGALLYLYLQNGGAEEAAQQALGLNNTRFSCAMATLRQLGLWQEAQKKHITPGERPAYSEKDVMSAMDTDGAFRMLYGEVQRVLGRSLNTEELKILLGFVRYLGLPAEVISVLVSYCKDISRQRSGRNPSLRAIEKEAYAWAEQGIDTLEAAAAFIHSQNIRRSRLYQLMNLLQIRGRALTPGETRYAQSWLDMDFPDDVVALAYEKTCINTGGMNWPYMDKILSRWKEAGYRTVAQIQKQDKKPGNATPVQRQPDAQERAAVARLMREG